MDRRLAAVLAADVVGYSRLISEDETGTLLALREHRRSLFDPETARHGGRIVKLIGDGTLVEFTSVVAAVTCAVAIQRALAREGGPIRLRIGINLGDVVIDGEDIYGDGVNVATRLEGLAAPGGICISASVHESLGNRVEAEFSDAGEHAVKNIARPIRVFRWRGDSPAVVADPPLVPAEVKRDNTIAVSRFQKLSDDTELGYFCEGLTEDIISALANIAQLTVVSNEYRASDSAAAHGQQSPHYILTGKVRRTGAKIRVSAQLFDRHTGVQCWADRFDRDATDLFDIQDDITRRIVIAVHTALGSGSYTNRWQWGTENFEAWQQNAKAFNAFQQFSPDSMRKSAAMWEEAMILDPAYVAPRAARAYCFAFLSLVEEEPRAAEYLRKAQEEFEHCVAQAPNDARPYSTKRAIETARGNYDAALAAAETALAMEPDDPACRASLAAALLCVGRPTQALAQITKAMQDVHDPSGWFTATRIECNYALGHLDEALAEARQLAADKPNFYPGAALAAALAAELGEAGLIEAMRARLLRFDPQFSAGKFMRFVGLKDLPLGARLLGALKTAGLPE